MWANFKSTPRSCSVFIGLLQLLHLHDWLRRQGIPAAAHKQFTVLEGVQEK